MPGRLITIILLISSAISASGAPSVNGLTAPGTVGCYGKLEVTFNVSTVATNPYWPYDPQPAANTQAHPNAVQAGVGVTVDGQFLPPGESDWANAVVQPAFYYQDYECQHVLLSNIERDSMYPVGSPVWKIRFAPTRLGVWRYRIRLQDSSGEALYTPNTDTFEVTPSDSRGFVRVSPTDPRYFETTADGRYLSLVGLEGVATWHEPSRTYVDLESYTYYHDWLYGMLSSNGFNIVRAWQSSMFSWCGQNGPLWWGGFEDVSTTVLKPGRKLTAILTNGSASTTVAVRGAKDYRFSAWVKIAGIGPKSPGDYGLCLIAQGERSNSIQNLQITDRIKTVSDWTQLSGTFRTHAEQKLSDIRISLDNATGTVYCVDMSCKEDNGGASLGPELIQTPNFETYTYRNQAQSYFLDRLLESAAEHDVYVKMMIQQRHDFTYGRMNADGSMSERENLNNFYALEPDHANRTYLSYYYRYIIARYSYATNLHTIEMENEASPFEPMVHQSVQKMAEYFRDNDPNRHMVSTTLWSTFPSALFWGNPSYPDVAYADWHCYVGQLSPTDGARPWWLGWENHLIGGNQGTEIWEQLFDKSTFRSAPSSLHISNSFDPQDSPTENKSFWLNSWPIAVVPGHRYTIRWYTKGSGLHHYGTPDSRWYPTVQVIWQKGYDGANHVVKQDYPRVPFASASEVPSTFNWTLAEFTATAPADAGYVVLRPANVAYPSGGIKGHLWFDDLTMVDETTGEVIEVPDGSFGGLRLDEDTALAGYFIGHAASYGDRRQVRKPVMDGNSRICGPNKYGNPYRTQVYTESNQDLLDDSAGVWFRKYIWSGITEFGVYPLYYHGADVMATQASSVPRSYHDFLEDIPLSNGHYGPARATTSNANLRAWGQKDVVNNRAHLWIDNVPYNFKAVVSHSYRPTAWSSEVTYELDSTCGSGSPMRRYRSKKTGNANHSPTDAEWWEDLGVFDAASNPPLPPPVSGTVTLTGLANGSYTVEWWDTVAGTVTGTSNVQCTNGSIVLSVQNLVSDTACRISPSLANIEMRFVLPTDRVAPGQVVTVTIEARNLGQLEATNVGVGMDVPPEMTYVDGSAEETSGAYDSATNRVSWTVPRILGGGTETRSYRARVR